MQIPMVAAPNSYHTGQTAQTYQIPLLAYAGPLPRYAAGATGLTPVERLVHSPR